MRRKSFYMYFKTADDAGLRLFYREAGDESKSTTVLRPSALAVDSHQCVGNIPARILKATRGCPNFVNEFRNVEIHDNSTL
jgi:hypothetical protein